MCCMFIKGSLVLHVLVLELFLVFHGHALEIVYAEHPICPDVVVLPFPKEHPCCFLVVRPPGRVDDMPYLFICWFVWIMEPVLENGWLAHEDLEDLAVCYPYDAVLVDVLDVLGHQFRSAKSHHAVLDEFLPFICVEPCLSGYLLGF